MKKAEPVSKKKSLNKKIDPIAKSPVELDKRMESLEVAVHGNTRRLESLNLICTVLNDKARRFEDAVSLLTKELREFRQESKVEFRTQVA